MDMNSILPLLLKKNDGQSNNDGQTDGTNNNNNNNSMDNMKLISSLLQNGGNVDQSTLFNTIANSSGNPQLAQTLSLAQNMRSNNTKKTNQPMGLRPIKRFASDDIMGKLTKFFN